MSDENIQPELLSSTRYGHLSVDEFAANPPREALVWQGNLQDRVRTCFEWGEAMYEESQRRMMQEEHNDPLMRLLREVGETMNNTKERGARMLEEVIEYCQSVGITHEQVAKQVAFTFNKPTSTDVMSELADVWVTLLAAAYAHGVQIYDLEQLAKTKLAALPNDYIRRRGHLKRFNGSLSFWHTDEIAPGQQAANDHLGVVDPRPFADGDPTEDSGDAA